jgi:glycine cleavage system regulatory protein
VETVAGLVASHSGNWLESRMARLGGQFAGIARVDIPGGREAGLRAALAELESQGLSVAVALDPVASPSAPAGRTVRLELVGHDRPGIVLQVTRVLASHRVNVEELTTGCVDAPMGGGLLFQAQAELSVPAGADMPTIRADLERIAADLMVDLQFAEAR